MKIHYFVCFFTALILVSSRLYAVEILPGVPTPPAHAAPHPVMPDPIFPVHPVMPHPIFPPHLPHPVMPHPLWPVHPVMPHPVMPNPIFPVHPVMPPINPFNPMPGPVMPANTCPSALSIELINSLKMGQLIFEDNGQSASFTVSPTGDISNIQNMHILGSRPASYLLIGPPGTIVTPSFNNIDTSNVHISNFTTNLPNNQCTLNTNGLCAFSIGATFTFPAHLNLKASSGEVDLEIPFTLNCVKLLQN